MFPPLSEIPAGYVPKILSKLGLPHRPPSADYLEQIIYAYTRTIPWESATRNVQRVTVGSPEHRPRWPETFWTLALEQGTGGTCFETNFAMFALLRRLGFDGYLTINDMPPNIGCHTAIVILLEGEKWLFDAGYPLEKPIRFPAAHTIGSRSECSAEFLDYQMTVTAESLEGSGELRNKENGEDSQHMVFEITRSRHPKPFIFNLIDKLISIEDYMQATRNDYRPEGNFNQSVVVNKIVNDRMIRFSTQEDGEHRFEAFTAAPNGGMAHHEVFEVSADLLPAELAKMFQMPIHILQAALKAIA